MIVLHTFGPNFGLPDPSPFVMKTEALLKLSAIPFQSKVGNLRNAPKGKLPYIEDDGVVIGDSTLIRLHLERKYGVDFDKGLSTRERGIAWAVEKMLEDNLYWAIVSERWLIDENFYKGPQRFFDAMPALLRPIVVPMIRKKVRKDLHSQGLGRHTRDELIALANRATDALAQVLGDGPYLLGANRCGADATAYAFAANILCPHFDTALRTHAEQHRNLVSYCARLQSEFAPA